MPHQPTTHRQATTPWNGPARLTWLLSEAHAIADALDRRDSTDAVTHIIHLTRMALDWLDAAARDGVAQ